MDIKIDQQVLSAATTMIAGQHGIFGGVLLAARDGTATMTGRSRSTAVVVTMPAETPTPGSVYLASPATLAAVVAAQPKGALSLAAGKTRSTLRSAAGGRYTLEQLPLDEFPANTIDDSDAPAWQVPAGTLARLLQQTAFSVSVDESRPALCGVLVDVAPGEVRCTSTDGHRLSTAWADAPCTHTASAILHRDGLALVQRSLGAVADAEVATVTIRAASVTVEVAGVVIQTRATEIAFPDWRRVVPAAGKSPVIVDRREMLAALRRGGVLKRSARVPVILRGADGRVVIEQAIADVGDAHEEVACEGGDCDVAVNLRYLVDILTACDADRVTIDAEADAFAPVLVSGGGSAEWVVMPMRR